MRSFFRTAILAAAAALMMVGTPGARAENVNVGSYPTNPPWEVKTDDGSFEGFEVELINEIARRLNMTVSIQDMNFQALFAAVASGRVDVVISSIAVTNDRLKSMSFTQPYYDSDMGLMTLKDSPIASFDSMKGKVVGALATSIAETWVKENSEKVGFADYRSYDTANNLLLDVQSGRLDGAVGDLAGFQYAATRMPSLHVTAVIPTGDKVALMLQKDSALAQKFDDTITAMKKDGTMATLFKKWFGVEPTAGSSVITPLPMPKAQ